MEIFSSERWGIQAWDKQDGQTEIVRAALCYAANGWPVVPLQTIDAEERSGDKSAYRRSRNWLNNLVTIHHADLIKRFWDKMPNSGLGIATGDESCIMAVHVYGDKGKEHVAHLKLPPTWQAEAPGSIIYYFRQPNHLLMPEGFLPGASQALPGIDIVATRCFAVVPPTVSQWGEPYSWRTPNGRPLADCPLSIIEVLEQNWRPCY